MQALTAIAPLLVVLVALHLCVSQSGAARANGCAEIFREMTGAVPPRICSNTKRAWFTDTLEDVNGVATTIRKMTAAAQNAGDRSTVVTSRSELTSLTFRSRISNRSANSSCLNMSCRNLASRRSCEMLDYIQREGFTEIIISTPGPIGLTALAAGENVQPAKRAAFITPIFRNTSAS